MRTLLVIVLLVGCQGRRAAPASDFGPKQVTTVELDGFTVPVPAGYRDSSELSDPTRRADIQARAPNAKILIAESKPGTGVMITISTLAESVETTPQRCIELATSLAKMSGGTPTEGLMSRLALGQSCKIVIEASGARTTHYYISHGGKILVLVCSGGQPGESDTICTDVATSAQTK